MRARRREREHVSGEHGKTPGNSNGKHHPRPARGQESSGNASNKRRSRSRKRRNKGPRNHEAGFWGDATKLPAPTQDVRITDDAAAVARSLGAPPLPGHERIASHYFRVVYERAVTTAGALAAAGGLIDPDALAQELSDQPSSGYGVQDR